MSSGPSKAPPAVPVSKQMKRKFQQLAANQELIQKLQKPAEESRYYDKAAPSTVARRQRARSNFEEFCKIAYGKTEQDDIFNIETITDYTCRFIEGMASMAAGKLSEKPKAGTLYQLKEALQWWIICTITNFSSIAQAFHNRVNAHIHMLAIDMQLSTEVRAKNILTDSELELLFDQIMNEGEDRKAFI